MANPTRRWSPERRLTMQQYWTPTRRAVARAHALRGWSETIDRGSRTRRARAAAPGSLDYWLARQTPAMRSAPMQARLAAATAARQAYFIELRHSRNRLEKSTGHHTEHQNER